MFPNLGPMEMMVVMLVAVLLFGKRLPEVGRSLGKGIVEFKKGIRGIEDDLDTRVSAPPKRIEPAFQSKEEASTSVPKFEPPTTAPVPPLNSEAESYRD